MKETIYYLIKPNEALLAKLQDNSTVDPIAAVTILGRSQLWTRTVREREPKHILIPQLKLLFLGYIHSTYIEEVEYPELQGLAIEVLAQPPYTTDTFDKWWKIEEFRFDLEYFDVHEASISLATLKLFSKVNEPYLDSWLAELISARSRYAL